MVWSSETAAFDPSDSFDEMGEAAQGWRKEMGWMEVAPDISSHCNSRGVKATKPL